jgi:hypothetical protein
VKRESVTLSVAEFRTLSAKAASSPLPGLLVQAKWLRQCAKEIAAAGHNGWGNTCLQAAEAIERANAENGEEQV